jgi:putative hydrolase of the HAD superfamily
MIKAITFDLDMTLIDFMRIKKNGSYAAANAMVKAGLKMPLKKCYEDLFKHYLTDIEGDRVFENFLKSKGSYSERILAAGINAYLKEKENNLKTFPQVKETLLKLKKKGIKIAIVTDAPRLKAYMRLDAIGIADLFDVVVGKEDTGRFKPSKMPFKKALKLLKVKPSEAMHVGDWPERDIKGAKSVGMKTCLANYGYITHKMGKYVKPDYKIEGFEEILNIWSKK